MTIKTLGSRYREKTEKYNAFLKELSMLKYELSQRQQRAASLTEMLKENENEIQEVVRELEKQFPDIDFKQHVIFAPVRNNV